MKPKYLTAAELFAAGDLDGDGRADIITAPGPGSPPPVRTCKPVGTSGLTELSSFDT